MRTINIVQRFLSHHLPISVKMSSPIVYKAVKSISAGEAFTMNYEGDYIVSPRLEITALRW
jgi:hypothetical protein